MSIIQFDIATWLAGPPIAEVLIGDLGEGMETAKVGRGACTRIERASYPGLHADIPYVRVWGGDRLIAEFCLHQIVGVVMEIPTA